MTMATQLALRLVTDDIWSYVEPLLPSARTRPQGGGRARVENRAVFTAVVFVLATGCTWHRLPPAFAVSASTAHRRFLEWTLAGLWDRVEHVPPDRRITPTEREWLRALATEARARVGRT
jgi:transposase